jgi:hypothetical protein
MDDIWSWSALDRGALPGFVFCSQWAIRSDRQNIGGELLGVAMHRQLETLGQKRLQQRQHLVFSGDRGIGAAAD